MALSRPMDGDTSRRKYEPMAKGMYKFQVVSWNEHPVEDEKRKFADVVGIFFGLKTIENPEYEGRKKRYYVTYWASDTKIEESYKAAMVKYMIENPTATPDDATKACERWRPQEALYAFLHAVGLMDIVDDKYVPLGWDISDPTPALNASIGRVFIGSVGPDKKDPVKYPDNIYGVYPVNEQ